MKTLISCMLTLSGAAGALGQSCGAWSATATPSPGASTNLLYDVATTGADAALAVGSYSDGVTAPQPLVMRWDGGEWSVLSLPETAGLGTMPSVQGIGRAPTGAAMWVVGYVRTPYPTDQMPLIIRWENGVWGAPVTPTLRPQTVYPFAARGGFAYDVTALSEDDVWVVGAAVGYGDASATSVGLALHFDGSSWTDVPVPQAGNRHHELSCVSASSSDNVWAVGDWRSIGGAFQALIVRWDGSSWSRVSNPGEGAGGGDAEAVLALAPDNVWVSGSFYGGSVRLIRWNGSAWETPTTGITGVVASFAATGTDDIWAADATNATIHHFDGVSWSASHSGGFPGSAYVLRGWGMDVYGACGVWAVGGYSDGAVQVTLAERPVPAPCRADFNADGTANSQDFFDFVSAFFELDGTADFNRDGAVNSQDFFDFLVEFFAGC
ncbi:MAG: GC-type dockerin domain-anchored protein [Phycisphaerales bacterium]